MALQDVFDFSPALASIAAATVILAILLYLVKNKDLPPGPTGFPIVGYLPFLKNEGCHLQLQKLAKKYGDMYSLRITGQLYIHLSSIKAIREAHIGKSDCLSSRCSSYSLLGYGFDQGVAFASGEAWLHMRKFFVQHLKKHGLSSLTDNLKELVSDSVATTIKELRNLQGEPFDVLSVLSDKGVPAIRQLIFGDAEISDQDLHKLLEAYVPILQASEGLNILLAGPIAQHVILPLMAGHREFNDGVDTMRNILKKIIKELENTLDENHPRNIIDNFIIERNNRLKRNDPTARHFTNKTLVSSLIQLVGDGNLPVINLVVMYLHKLVEHPDIQQTLYEEIIDIIGHDRQPTIEDKSRLPYANAFIYEVLRDTDGFPVFPSVEFTTETTMRGYRIPKGTVTLMNIYAAQHDPDVYKDPEKFDPCRYIATPDKPKAELPIMFGVGKRQCIGEGYAMTQAFLYMVTIVKNFRLTSPEGSTLHTPSLTSAGKTKICAHPRN